ncbi:MAG TPA: hypothetical protein VGF12_10875 [Roseateles sp.]|uniref:hypothetical protein n=1 Tax=Roseateles sp. TaxID=1971397 RepID=UPI002EDB0EAB
MKTTARLMLSALCLGAGLLGGLDASATTPGPTRVIQCPGSAELRQAPSINSGNTFGATFWTDGYMVAPMLPQFPAITRCTTDGPFFWVSSAQVVGRFQPGQRHPAPPQAWLDAPVVRALTGDEFLQAIAQGLGETADRLSHLRHRVWWEANHAHRRATEVQDPTSESDFPPGSATRANLEALLASLEESDPEQLLTKIEALRELARFDEADRLLASAALQDGPLQPWVRLIRERVRLRDARVTRLKTER